MSSQQPCQGSAAHPTAMRLSCRPRASAAGPAPRGGLRSLPPRH